MGKVAKKVAIARSGVYEYSAEALPGLGLSLPPDKQGKGTFGVYRPSTILAKAKDKFTRLPVTLEHPNELVNGNNFRKLAQGFTGDAATIEYLKDINEVTINSTITLMDNEAVNAYYRGIVEVSPGYIGVFDWEDGVSPNKEHYDIVMRDILEVNHLALTRAGRGGSSACILDSRDVGLKKRSSGLFYSVAKLLGVTKDSSGSFTEKVSTIIANRFKMSKAEMESSVADLRLVVDYLPDSEDKSKLSRYVDDLSRIDEEADDAANMIGLLIGNLFYTLDTAAMADAPTLDSEDKKESPEPGESKEEHSSEGPDHEQGEDPKEEKAEHEAGGAPPGDQEETSAPEKEITAEDVSIGLDDTIFDKPEKDLTPEECEYVHTKLMEMLKEFLHNKAVVNVKENIEAEAPLVEGEEKSGDKSEENMADDKEKTEEKDQKAPGEAEKKVSDSAEPQYPSDTLTDDSVHDSDGSGIDLQKYFKETLKGGK